MGGNLQATLIKQTKRFFNSCVLFNGIMSKICVWHLVVPFVYCCSLSSAVNISTASSVIMQRMFYSDMTRRIFMWHKHNDLYKLFV